MWQRFLLHFDPDDYIKVTTCWLGGYKDLSYKSSVQESLMLEIIQSFFKVVFIGLIVQIHAYRRRICKYWM